MAGIAGPLSCGCFSDWHRLGLPEYLMIQILAVTRLRGFAFNQCERPRSIGLPFSSQKNSGVHAAVLHAVGRLKLMRHTEDLDVPFQQGAGDLPGDFRALSLVCRRKGFLNSSIAFGVRLSTMTLILPSSSSSLPLSLVASSSRLKCV